MFIDNWGINLFLLVRRLHKNTIDHENLLHGREFIKLGKLYQNLGVRIVRNTQKSCQSFIHHSYVCLEMVHIDNSISAFFTLFQQLVSEVTKIVTLKLHVNID